MLTLNGLDEVKEYVGQEFGVSDWQDVTQQSISDFADVTDDHQFIHVDVEKAKNTPFGGTIAHGYYTLSLAPGLQNKIFSLKGFAFTVNYGLNRVRFPAPLPVGNKVRMRAKLVGVDDIPGGGQLTVGLTFECEGIKKPVCLAESLARVYTG